MIIRRAATQAVFDPGKMGKLDLVRGQHLFAGLNCFLPGQEHMMHMHPDQDKLYLILDGSGEAAVGEESGEVAAGDLVFARAGIPHAMKNTGAGTLTVLVVFAPPSHPK